LATSRAKHLESKTVPRPDKAKTAKHIEVFTTLYVRGVIGWFCGLRESEIRDIMRSLRLCLHAIVERRR
jgi:hypothetical protein